MKNNNKKILDEIFSLEPELRTKEKELYKIIDTLIETKPNFEISASFRKKLKNKLLNSNKIENTKFNYFQIISWFLVWWLSAFSIAWIMGVNFQSFDMKNKEKLWEVWIMSASMMSDEIWGTEIMNKSNLRWWQRIMTTSMDEEKPMEELSKVFVDAEPIEKPMLMMFDDNIVKSENTNELLILELEDFFEKNYIDIKYFDWLLSIILKYIK